MCAAVRGPAVRVALGSVAPTVIRLPRTEAVLTSGGTLEAAQDVLRAEIAPIDDIRSTAAYRRAVARTCSRISGQPRAGPRHDRDRAFGCRSADIACAARGRWRECTRCASCGASWRPCDRPCRSLVRRQWHRAEGGGDDRSGSSCGRQSPMTRGSSSGPTRSIPTRRRPVVGRGGDSAGRCRAPNARRKRRTSGRSTNSSAPARPPTSTASRSMTRARPGERIDAELELTIELIEPATFRDRVERRAHSDGGHEWRDVAGDGPCRMR